MKLNAFKKKKAIERNDNIRNLNEKILPKKKGSKIKLLVMWNDQISFSIKQCAMKPNYL